MLQDIKFREIVYDDYDELKQLHEEFFPIRYTDKFFKDACDKKGLRGSPLFTSIAYNDEGIIGFIFAQYFKADISEDCFIVTVNKNVQDIFYILTLGVRNHYRRSGLASILVKQAIRYAKCNVVCGAVYLHVLDTNYSAIRLYEKNGFQMYKKMTEFYHMDEGYRDALLYVYYINYGHPPLTHLLYKHVVSIMTTTWISITTIIAKYIPLPYGMKDYLLPNGSSTLLLKNTASMMTTTTTTLIHTSYKISHDHHTNGSYHNTQPNFIDSNKSKIVNTNSDDIYYECGERGNRAGNEHIIHRENKLEDV